MTEREAGTLLGELFVHAEASSKPLANAPFSFQLPTALAAEHRRLMDARHRPIDWGASTASSLPREVREVLADLWRERSIAEHRSIGLFATYAVDLAGFGAPAELLSLACRAALDEVRHAELMSRVASLYSGHDETPPAGAEAMPDDESLPLAHQVAREALYLSVAAETFSMMSLSEQHRRAIDPVVRDVYAVLLADEVHHARMGWTLLDLLLGRGGEEALALREYLEAEVPLCFEHFVAFTFGDSNALPPPRLSGDDLALAEGHGFVAPADQLSLYRAAIADVWTPGFAALGLSVVIPG